MIDLSAIVETDALGEAPAEVALGELVAESGVGAEAWQAPAPALGGRKPEVQDSDDLARVAALPRRERPSEVRMEAMADLLTARFRRDNPGCECRERWNRACVVRLRPEQAWALFEMRLAGGMVGSIAVGLGKTLVNMLAPLALRAQNAVLLVPASLVDQAISDYERYGQHFQMPSLVAHGRPTTIIVPGAPTMHLMSYDRLSRESYCIKLDEEIRPDLVICDEVQNLRNRHSTRTGRVTRLKHKHPGTRFVVSSGSLTNSKVADYARAADWALGDGSPVPRADDAIDDWGRAIDAPDPGKGRAPAGALVQLCRPREHYLDEVARRFRETPGVVTTIEASVKVPIIIEEMPRPEVPYEIEEALRHLRATWVRPDGEKLMDPLSVARVARELACGFHYYWFFPHINGVPQLVADILDWLDARKEWRSEVCEELKRHREHLDSPLLLARAAMRYYGDLPCNDAARAEQGLPPLPRWASRCWPRWRDTRGAIVYETRARRMDPFFAETCAEEALKGDRDPAEKCILWYLSKEFGLWVAELSGLPLHGGGPKAGKRIAAERGERSIIASIKSHGTGRDGLQYLYRRNVIAQIPSSSEKVEQLLGRTHRPGIETWAKDVWAGFYRHTPETAICVDRAVLRAEYVRRTMGAPQKILLGLPQAYLDGKLADWRDDVEDDEAAAMGLE